MVAQPSVASTARVVWLSIDGLVLLLANCHIQRFMRKTKHFILPYLDFPDIYLS